MIDRTEQQIKLDKARNINTTISELITLSDDDDWLVRSWVAKNISTNNEILKKLSEDSDFFVRASVIFNPKCSMAILEKLSFDQDDYVTIIAQKSLDTRLTEVLEAWK